MVAVVAALAAAAAVLPCNIALLSTPSVACVAMHGTSLTRLCCRRSLALPWMQEPNFYTSRCQDNALTCSLHEQQKYINRVRLRLACQLQARSAQALVTEAVDRFLADLPELEPLAAHPVRQRLA